MITSQGDTAPKRCNVYFQEKPTVSELYEERFHVYQAMNGDYLDSSLGVQEMILRREIDAQNYLLDLGEWYNIPIEETEQTKLALKEYEDALRTLLEGRR